MYVFIFFAPSFVLRYSGIHEVGECPTHTTVLKDRFENLMLQVLRSVLHLTMNGSAGYRPWCSLNRI